ncbi:type VII secretion-associated serine protease mycosin [Micromonosporaceae bacterium DT194]|uniref:type VII secretion-associated serine protease mycosin n=1 Tax=Melissospora conviva TaxID=3388432 RepID=UPI003C262AE8
MAEGVTEVSRSQRTAGRFAVGALLAVTVQTGLGVPAQAMPAPAARAAATVNAPAFAAPLGEPLAAESVRAGQWQVEKLNAAAAWRTSTGSGVTVAVIDSGVDGSHVDLAGQVLPGKDFVFSDSDGRWDPVGHGTTVAGLIAGRADDAAGVVGLAPDAKILPVRVLDDDNRYEDATVVAEGVRWAVDNGAQVVNLSLGGSGASPALAAAIDYAFARDVVVVACTGNVATSSNPNVWYPAREPGVIAVTGLEQSADELWSGAISGTETVLAAPATGLIGAKPDGYWQVQGTSFAAPLVSAAAALIRSRWPDMSAGDVVNRLLVTARDLGPQGRDDRYGFGLVDPVAALNSTIEPVHRNPLDDDVRPGFAGFGGPPGLEQAAAVEPAEARSTWLLGSASLTDASVPLISGFVLLTALAAGTLLLRRSRRYVPRRYATAYRPDPAPDPAYGAPPPVDRFYADHHR